MKDENIKTVIISILALIGTYCITAFNVQLPMVEDNGSIFIKVVSFIVLFGFFTILVHIHTLFRGLYQYQK